MAEVSGALQAYLTHVTDDIRATKTTAYLEPLMPSGLSRSNCPRQGRTQGGTQRGGGHCAPRKCSHHGGKCIAENSEISHLHQYDYHFRETFHLWRYV